MKDTIILLFCACAFITVIVLADAQQQKAIKQPPAKVEAQENTAKLLHNYRGKQNERF